MTEPVWLLPSTLIAIHTLTIATHGGSPDVRDMGLLDSALARPRNLFLYQERTALPDLAAAYAAEVMGCHPFIDGNKRTGFIAAATFLDLNQAPLQAGEAAATAMTLALAAGEGDEAAYAAWLAENLGSAQS